MIKRLFDIFVSTFILLFFVPIFIVLIPLCFLFLGAPVLFIQTRTGVNGKPFKIIKLRTMKSLYNENNQLLEDKYRVSKFGTFLRSTSLDELPELLNVLKGDMSLVGPRPLLVEYLPLYNDHQYKRHLVRPGITGLAQISGRNSLSWNDRFYLDVYYVENISFFLDLKILCLTIYKVIKRDGINAKNEATMSKFMGNNY